MISQEFIETLAASINLDILDLRVKGDELAISLDDWNSTMMAEGVVFWGADRKINLAFTELMFTDEYGDEFTMTEAQEQFLISSTELFTE